MPEANYQHFFGDKLIIDTICLLTYDNHNREECRRFKNKLKGMSSSQLRKWLDEPYNKSEFCW